MFPPDCAIVGVLHCNQSWPPEKNRKGQFGLFLLQDCRLSTALKYFESPPSTQNCDRYSRQCNEHFIRGDQNFWFIHHNGGSLFSLFRINDYFLSHYALLENHYERSLLLNIQRKNRSQSMLVLCWIDSHIRKLPNDWLCLKLPFILCIANPWSLTTSCMPMDCFLVMQGTFRLVSGDQECAFNNHFYQISFFIGIFPKKVGPIKGLQGALWPLSNIFWLKHWAHVFAGFYTARLKNHQFTMCISWQVGRKRRKEQVSQPKTILTSLKGN